MHNWPVVELVHRLAYAHVQPLTRVYGPLSAPDTEACGEWAHDGSVSMAAWLRHHCRMSNGDAASLVRRGRFLDKFAIIAEAALKLLITPAAFCAPAATAALEGAAGAVASLVAEVPV